MEHSNSEILIYQSEDGQTKIDVQIDGETVWLSQAQMVELFQTSKQMFKEVYAAIEQGKQPENPTFPTFADGYRELLICERILESSRKQKWVKV